MVSGRQVVVRPEQYQAWLEETPPDIVLDHMEFTACLYPGAPDREGEDGVTIVWSDKSANDWAEHYSDLPTAVARLAALIRSVETYTGFRDGPEGFVRWSEIFLGRACSPTPQPEIPSGLG